MRYSAAMPARAEHDWVEVALDYRCNMRCLGCRACDDTGERLAAPDVLQILHEARARGVPNLWVGGGEPTLRDDLPSIVAAARALGFSRVLLQTNGLRLAYARYADALVRAGVTDFSFNVKSHRADVHDALGRREGSHALLLRAVDNVVAHGVRVSADVLLARSTVRDLEATVRDFAGRGVRRFTLWLLSSADADDPDVRSEVPTYEETRDPVRAASVAADALGVELVSLHTPPCTLPSEHRHRYLPARALRLVVIDPSGRSFPLEASPFEGGAYVDGCAGCASRSRCGGLRADYLSLHGPSGVDPIGPARG